MKRYHEIQVFVSTDGTTGSYVGRSARGGITFPRAYTIIAANANFYCTATTTNTKFKMMLYKNKTTTIGSFINGSAVRQCTTTGFKSKAISALTAPSISTSNRVWFDITNHADGLKKISVTFQLIEA
jgi:hypothetical protein